MLGDWRVGGSAPRANVCCTSFPVVQSITVYGLHMCEVNSCVTCFALLIVFIPFIWTEQTEKQVFLVCAIFVVAITGKSQ